MRPLNQAETLLAEEIATSLLSPKDQLLMLRYTALSNRYRDEYGEPQNDGEHMAERVVLLGQLPEAEPVIRKLITRTKAILESGTDGASTLVTRT
jgi:hypothetical protein